MDNQPKKDKSKLKIRPEDIIFGNKPETDILRQIYSALKGKSYDSLGLLERSWIYGIEKLYKEQVKVLMEQVYEILHQKEDLWVNNF